MKMGNKVIPEKAFGCKCKKKLHILEKKKSKVEEFVHPPPKKKIKASESLCMHGAAHAWGMGSEAAQFGI